MNQIELILDHSEFDESFSENERWQRRAETKLIKKLRGFGQDAKESKAKIHENALTQHVHNAILITGGRGTGKTVFLKNTKSIWESDETYNKPCLHFTPIIDPTLLHHKDNFTNVLVAHIYNEVSNELKIYSDHKLQDKQEKFHDKLRALADAIEQPCDAGNHVGIDKIIHYSSGIRIDALFFDFVKSATEILNCDAIVLLIDDVDMALNQAYPVLEEIRRRLSSPHIIPIISGDLDLYQRLVKLNIVENLVHKSMSDTDKRDNQEKGKILTDAYLTKVLPHQSRISMQAISDLLAQIKIKDNNLHQGVNYLDYQKLLINAFFGSINGEEKSTDFPWPNSAREMNQMVRSLPPNDIKKDEKDNVILNIEHWENLRTLAESKHHGACFVLASTILQMQQPNIRFSELMAFNVKQQAQLDLPWAKYNFISEQKYFALSFDKENQNNTNLLNSAFNRPVLRSMPPIEMFTNALTITKINAIEEDPNFLAIYTHNAYYGNHGSQQRKIYFSRAFEILATSFLNASDENTDKENNLTSILNTHPFYSIHALNPTKTITEDDNGEENDEENDDTGTSNDETIKNLIQDINDWINNNKETISSFSKQTNIIALLSAVFNKTFSQLALLRENYKKNHPTLEDDCLHDAILRFKYTVINSFAFFLKLDGVVSANLALTTTVKTLREESKFKTKSQTYMKNVSWIDSILTPDEFDQKNINKENLLAAKLISSIRSHPVFSFIDIDGKKTKIRASSGNQATKKLPRRTTNKIKTSRGKLLSSIGNIKEKHDYSSLKRMIEDIEKNIVDTPSQIDLLNSCISEMEKRKILFNNLSKSHQKIVKLLSRNTQKL